MRFSGIPYAIDIKWLKRRAVSTNRPNGTPARGSSAASVESMPRHPPDPRLPAAGLMVPTSNAIGSAEGERCAEATMSGVPAASTAAAKNNRIRAPPADSRLAHTLN